jgi:thiol-disulfide isomerase/thioredoxin
VQTNRYEPRCRTASTRTDSVGVAAPEVEKWAQQFRNVKFLKVNVDQQPAISARFGVRAMPTFKLLLNGAQVAEVVGADTAKCLQELQKLAAQAGTGDASSFGGAGQGYRLGGSAAPPPRSSGSQAAPIDVDGAEDDFDDAALVVPSLPLQPAAPSPFLDELTGMGFSKAHASKALRATGDKSIDAAVDWIMENPDPAPTEQPPVAPETTTTTTTTTTSDHASDVAEVDAMVATDGETKEAFEVRKKQFMDKLAKIRADKAKKEEMEKRDAEIKRVREAKESQAMREQWASQKDKIEAERAKKEKAAELAHKQALKRQVEQDKLNRKAEREAKTAALSGAKQTAPVAAAVPVAATPAGEKKVYTEAQVSVQLPSGLTIEKAFPVDTTVADVAAWVREHTTVNVALLTPFPRVAYDTIAKQATKLSAIDGFVPRGKFLCKV